MTSRYELLLYDNAKRAVAQLLSVDEVRDNLDRAAAVQEYAKRARDRELEMRAAEYRVYCERRLGEFSAAASRERPGRNWSSGNSSDTSELSRVAVARDAGVSEATLRRKHEPLASVPDESFDSAVTTCKANGEVPTARRVLDVLHSTKGAGNEGADQWNTPDEIIEFVARVLGGIDLDPCSDAGRNVPAARHYTQSDDGLSKPWRGTVYVNPPYSEAKAWVDKLNEEIAASNVTGAVVLVPARPDTRWFDALRDYPVCFVRGRLRFKGARDPAPFPSALFYLGDDEDSFCEEASALGNVYVRMDR